MKKALVNGGGKVVNVVFVPENWTGTKPGEWAAPPGMSVVDADGVNVGPGDTYDKASKTFSKAANVVPPSVPTVEQRLATLESKAQSLETDTATMKTQIAVLLLP